MLIEKIHLERFRGFSVRNFAFFEGKNIIVGNNATGKTTILEAISFLSSCKSPRTNNVSELIKIDSLERSFFILGQISKNDEHFSICVGCDGKNKIAQKNGQYVKKISEFVDNFESIYFQPNEVYSFLAASSNRRNIFNQIMFKCDREFNKNIRLYNRTLKAKNALLAGALIGNKERELLVSYNQYLFNLSRKIYKARVEAVKEINCILLEQNITLDDQEIIQVEYLPYSDYLKDDFNNLLVSEIQVKSSMWGPHKDDFNLLINGQNIKMFGSLGQQKSALICLKLALLDFFQKHNHEYPVLLLDDAFGELDAVRQNRLIAQIKENVQTIMTTTSLNELQDSVKQGAAIMMINKDNCE